MMKVVLQSRERKSSINSVGSIVYSSRKKKEKKFVLYFTAYSKTNFRWIKSKIER